MNTYINKTQVMDICENCPNLWGRQRRINSESWVDDDTQESCVESTFEIVCEHAQACRRVMRLMDGKHNG